MGITYLGNSNNESAKPKAIYAGNGSNLSKLVKAIYVGNSSGKSVEVYRNSKLPSAYQKVEYIYNTNGTEYINTGIRANSDTRIYIHFYIAYNPFTTANYHMGFLGYAESHGNNLAYTYNASTNWRSICYSWGNQSWESNNKDTGKPGNTYELDANRDYHGKTYLNNNLIISSQDTFSTVSQDYLLFGYMESGTPHPSSNLRYYVYSFKVWQSGTMIRDMYPCYLKTDTQVIGLYDLANNQFYGNDGTGIFYKGPDVN